jgi:pyruvate dehydrogenase E2 component (dihydrolipoamide acetyltransferase)
LAANAAKEAPPKEEKTPEAPEPSKEPSTAPSTASKPELPKGDRIYASPIAKKIALERGIPLSKVKGTGPDGRIIREDIEKYKPEPASAGAPTPADYVDIPLSNMRRTIAARLAESKVQSPHYYLTVDIQMDKVLKLREVFNKSLAEKGAKLSINDFVVKAVAKALEDVPEANSAWLGDIIRQ